MTEDLILWFVVLGIGFLIGYNWTPKENKKQEVNDLSIDVTKLQEELVVYKNLKESLLADVKYWRDKANKK